MNLEIRSVAEKGIFEKERLIIRVRSDVSVGDFLLMQTGWNGTAPTTFIHHALWFPNGDVKGGDLVVVYTKKGKQNTKSLDDGHTAHFFYWGLAQSIWAATDRCAVLLAAPSWSSKPAKDL